MLRDFRRGLSTFVVLLLLGSLSGRLHGQVVPVVSSITPSSRVIGAAGFTLSVSGSGFSISSKVLWNGSPRATSYIGPGSLTAQITNTDVSASGIAFVQVVTPGLNGASSLGKPFTTYVSLPNNDLAYDPGTGKLYASVPSTSLFGANSIVPINPATGQFGTPVFVGSEPAKIAVSDNGQYLYVGLNGAAAVRRMDLATQTAGLQFNIGVDDSSGALYVEDMEVLPGAPESVAISRRNLGFSPRHEGVAIYDNGVKRPVDTPGHTGSNVLEFLGSASTLYGYNNEVSSFDLFTMAIDANGVSIADQARNLISGYGVDIRGESGKIYSTSGRTIDPVTQNLVGTYSATGLVAPDGALNRTFYFPQFSQEQIRIFDLQSFVHLGSLDVPGLSGTPRSMVRWGDAGLAVGTDSKTT